MENSENLNDTKTIQENSDYFNNDVINTLYNESIKSLDYLNLKNKNILELYSKLEHDKENTNIKKTNNNSKSLEIPNIIKHYASKSSKELHLVTTTKNKSENLIQNLIKNIELIPNKEEVPSTKINNLGSLYRLFFSEYFDIHLLLCYLDKKEERGITDTLVNIIYEKFINESFFYIPQLCTMITYKNYYESLENYLLDRCVDQMKFSLKIHWLISSYTENAEIKIVKKYDKLIQRIEMTLVNGRRATLSSFKLYNLLHIKTEEEVYKHSLDKEFRLNYFDKVMRFYHDLKNMCEKLKEYPKENKIDPSQSRNGIMRNYLNNFNKNISKMYHNILEINTNELTKSLYRGYILPFDDSDSTMDDYNSLIVNFLPEYSFCFSTKARVPVKITVECIRVLECQFWDELIEIDEVENNMGDNQSNYIQTEENYKIESHNLNINEYSSIEDFFNKLSNSNNNFNNNFNQEEEEKRKKEKEIEKIVNKIKEANENEKYIPRLSLLKRDSKISEIHQNIHEENFLYDNSEDTINPFGNKWSDIVKQIKEKSKFRNFETYCVKCFIAKANDDLRQEVMTLQLIKRFDDIFKIAEIPLKLRPYEILITSPKSGLIEFLPNTISIDALKKNLPQKWNLNLFFRKFFTNNFEEAQKNFAESLAAYCLVSYIVQIRDRHNGNILLDLNGNIIHIDFGFILGISPGNLSFENAPFKLTSEYVEILDGPDSNIFHYFKSLILRGLMELRKHVDSFVKIIDIMARGSKMPCFKDTDTSQIISLFAERFHANKSETEYIEIVDELIYNSIYNWRTVQYDNFQRLTNDIRP